MKSLVIFSITLVVISSIIVSQFLQSENEISTYIENSVPYVGTEIPRTDGLDGSGIKVAVIDTGVDFNHPDLLGWGPDGKVIGGYNFIQTNQLPMDRNGHGTKVAGIIAADGSTLGVAPTVNDSKFLPGLPMVFNSGPSFPAAVTTKIPFSNA